MRISGYGRYALTGCVAVAMLAGCGGSQPPIGVPAALLQSSAIKSHGNRAGLWIPAGPSAGRSADYAASGSLLYVANANIAYNNVTVYRAGAKDPAPIATISDGLNGPASDCLDSQGDPTDIRNIWPQPIVAAKKKDEVENQLHDFVCSGRMSITQAQAAIARDWKTAVSAGTSH